ELYILATAAIRDAEDGKAFVQELEAKHGVKVSVISGKQEAKLAAKGVQASLHQPEGLVGDLGGGSLELVHLQNGRLLEQTSLQLGALRLKESSGQDVSKAAGLVEQALDALPWMEASFPCFYAIGGSFRMLAHMHQLKTGYPLEVLHGYAVASAEFIPFLKEVAAMAEEDIAQMPGSSTRRALTLAYAAAAMVVLLERTGIPQVVFSTAGIREGYLYRHLSPYLQQEDGLISCCVDLASQNGRVESYPRDLFHWMSPLFPDEPDSLQRLRFACCILSEFAWRVHPQYRAEWQFTRIIQSSFIGLSHEERVMLALALYHRHKLKTPLSNPALELLGEQQQLWCQAVGQAMLLG
ncbi:MAG: hypothetical protein ACPG80_06020, partial [Rickettsiales bacterium]